ncbi:MAG: glutamyl-tRNA reductase, partial [Blautia sp.]
NYTLRTDLFKDTVLERPVVIIDLAVPRDVEPELSKMEQVTLYDMDSFKAEALGEEQRESLHRAGAIVHEQMEEFYQWLDGRDVIPRIQEIKMDAVNDLNLRIAKILKATPMEEKDRERLIQVIDTAAGKVVNKMIFGLRDTLEQEAFLECVAGLEKLYEE